MRTLVHVDLRKPGNDDLDKIRAWLTEVGFRPKDVVFSEDQTETIKKPLAAGDIEKALSDIVDVSTRHAAITLCTIPLDEQERQQALETAIFSIHRNETIHGATVWGLVCFDSPTVTIRLRHKVSRSLEKATEEFVANVWEETGQDKIFREFPHGQTIPVREPVTITDVYSGVILPPGPKVKDLAKKERASERKIALVALIATIVCFGLGGVVFYFSNPDTLLRWWSGAFDRLATAGASTAVVSYLNYLFHLHELQSKPIIDWK